MFIASTEGFHQLLCCHNCLSFSLRARAMTSIRLCPCGKRRTPKHAAVVPMLQ